MASTVRGLLAALLLALLMVPAMPAWACEGLGPLRQIDLGQGSHVARATICLAPGMLTTLLFDRPLRSVTLPAEAQQRLARWEEGSTMLRLEPLLSFQPQELRIQFKTSSPPSAVVLSLRLERPGSPRADAVVNLSTEALEPTSCREALRQKTEEIYKLQELCTLRQIELDPLSPSAQVSIPLAAFIRVLRESRPLALELAAAWADKPLTHNHVMNGHLYRSSGWSLLRLGLLSPADMGSGWLAGEVRMEDLAGNVIQTTRAVVAGDGSMLVGLDRELHDQEDFALKLWADQGKSPLLHYRVVVPAAPPPRPAEPGGSR